MCGCHCMQNMTMLQIKTPECAGPQVGGQPPFTVSGKLRFSSTDHSCRHLVLNLHYTIDTYSAITLTETRQ